MSTSLGQVSISKVHKERRRDFYLLAAEPAALLATLAHPPEAGTRARSPKGAEENHRKTSREPLHAPWNLSEQWWHPRGLNLTTCRAKRARSNPFWTQEASYSIRMRDE